MMIEAWDWPGLLVRVSAALLATADVVAWVPSEALATSYLGHAGASEVQIQEAERRLGVRLPPSYRAFLATSNGFISVDGRKFQRLLAVDEIGWCQEISPNMVDAYLRSLQGTEPWTVPDEDYFDYSERQDPANTRMEFLPSLLQISADAIGVYLLNPFIQTSDGEWEAWYLDPKLPGANRQPSFWALMVATVEHTERMQDWKRRRPSAGT